METAAHVLDEHLRFMFGIIPGVESYFVVFAASAAIFARKKRKRHVKKSYINDLISWAVAATPDFSTTIYFIFESNISASEFVK